MIAVGWLQVSGFLATSEICNPLPYNHLQIVFRLHSIMHIEKFLVLKRRYVHVVGARKDILVCLHDLIMSRDIIP
jgi:hypothetical protein